jgi:hypothetical protein
MLEVADDVNASHQGVQRGQLASHFDNSEIPTSIAGYEENYMGGLRRLSIDREWAEGAKLNVIFLDFIGEAH